MITEVHQEARFYRMSTGRAAHYENIKPHNPSTEDWCIPADLEEGGYLMMDPACEVNEKGTREKNDGNEVVEEGTDTPLDLDPNEVIGADDETLPYAEEDWQDPEQTEVPKNLEPDLPFMIQTRQKDGTRPRKKYNPYDDDFVVDRIDLKKIVEEVVGLEEITVSQDIDIVDDHDDEWVDDWSKPEVEFDDEQQQSYEQDLMNLRVLEWLNETTSDPEETSVTIQDVDRESMKYIKTERDDPSWAAQEGRLLTPASNLDLIPGMRSTGTSMDIFVRGVGVGLTHTENLIIKKLRIARETGDLEAETGEEPKKPDIGRVVESYFNLPNKYSSNIILTDSDFLLTNRTNAIAITADMSFRTALAADFKREYKNVEFLWKQRPAIGGVAALPPAASQIPGKYLCFLVTRATEKQHVDPAKMPAKKLSRIIDVQKNNQLKYNFTGVPETDPRACFNRANWSPAVNLQQPPLGTSHLILGDSLVRVLSNLRTSWVTTVMAFGGATIAQLYRMEELMNPGRIPNVMILVGTNDISRGSDEQEALWESMMVCLFTTLWHKFNCAVLTVCTVPMNTRSLAASGRRHNEGVVRWNNILRNLASRNAGRMILMDIEPELRAMDQAKLTTDGIHFDSIEGQAWLNRVFQERLDELEAELFETGVLKEEGTVSDAVITTFVPPSLETRLGTIPAVTNYRQQSSSEPGQRTDVQDRLGEAPMRRTIHPRRRIGPVNPIEETAGTSRSDTRSDTRSETTSNSREERRPSRGSLMWSRTIPSPWHVYKYTKMSK